MNFSIILWNIRGLGKAKKARAVRRLMTLKKPLMLFLQETKLSYFNLSILRKIGCKNNFDSLVSTSSGSSCGLITIWDLSSFEVSYNHIDRRFITIIGKFKVNQFECGLINFYGPSIEEEKGHFFVDLLHFMSNFDVSWGIGGDFNAHRCSEEKHGVSLNLPTMDMLRNFIQAACLVDLPLKGGSFTWSNNRDPRTFVRLDQFLVADDFLTVFPDLNQMLLSKSIYDHNAILLENVGYCNTLNFCMLKKMMK
ncbi:hypothetical protein HRI_003225100 [Hibiscus trionum]|uniref:Endonuclease/exonuclease/phosphatase domain-containing protein n=1 Tax=Hibiscus trionum TaxID=183268 RepID=A0A9W7IK07_HIBTR|nr:hypothetical protein HRI_003225100 [Hibiscus trionum]